MSQELQKEVVRRLRNVQGHLAGLARMVETGQDCADVLHQLAAARAALDKITELMLEGYVAECLARDRERDAMGRDARDLVRILRRFLR
ncbi:MAG: metal-sensitive transcriptional regulator [Desulfotomaculales bacterium]